MTPLITIIIPTYNRKELLEKAIHSVLHQTRDVPFEHELIIIDDGSNDGTSKYIKHLVENPDNKITYRYQENSGVGKARNHGLSLMNKRSDYLIFLDSDDELMPTLISTCLDEWEKLRGNGEYENTLGFYFLCEDEYGNIIGNRDILLGENSRILTYDAYLSGVINIEMGLMTKSSLFREEPRLRFEEDITTEGVMWAKMWKYMGEKSIEIRVLNIIGRLYRKDHTGEIKITRSISRDKFRKNAIGNERVLSIIGDDLIRRGYTSYYQTILIQGILNWFLYGEKNRGITLLEGSWQGKKDLKIVIIWILSLLPKNVLLFLYKKYNEY